MHDAYERRLQDFDERLRRALWEGDFDQREGDWVDLGVLCRVLPPHRQNRPSLGTRFSWDGRRWELVAYDKVRDAYLISDRGPLAKQAPRSNAPQLGGRSGLSGREPMISRKE